MNIERRIDADLKNAILEGASLTVETLRDAKSQFSLVKTKKGNTKTFDDFSAIATLNKMVKQRRSSIELFLQGNRKDIADKELAEIEILSKYIPPKLTNKELVSLVEDVFSVYKPTSKKDISQIVYGVSEQALEEGYTIDKSEAVAIITKLLP